MRVKVFAALSFTDMSDGARLDEILCAHRGREGALLPILNDVQAAFGHIDGEAIRTIAKAQNLSRAEVSGVVSFYHDYRSSPPERPIIKLCGAEACQARGANVLLAGVKSAPGARVSVETSYCLGLCGAGPAAMVEGRVFARLDTPKLAALIDTIA